MNLFARILSHGFAIVIVLLLAVGLIYRGELFPDWELPEFLSLDTPTERGDSDTDEAPAAEPAADTAIPPLMNGEDEPAVAPETPGDTAPEESTEAAAPEAEVVTEAAEPAEAPAPAVITEAAEPAEPPAPAVITEAAEPAEAPAPAVVTEAAEPAEAPAPAVVTEAAAPAEAPAPAVATEAAGPADVPASAVLSEEAGPAATATAAADTPVPPATPEPAAVQQAIDGSATIVMEETDEPAATEQSVTGIPEPGSHASDAVDTASVDTVTPATAGEAAPVEAATGVPLQPPAAVTREQQVQQAAEPVPPAATPQYSEVTAPQIPAPASTAPAETGTYQILAAAREAYWLRDYESAERNYRQLTVLEPDNPDGYGELGNMYFSQGLWEQAATAYFEAGTRLVKEGQLEQAQQLVDVIRGLDGTQADELNELITATQAATH